MQNLSASRWMIKVTLNCSTNQWNGNESRNKGMVCGHIFDHMRSRMLGWLGLGYREIRSLLQSKTNMCEFQQSCKSLSVAQSRCPRNLNSWVQFPKRTSNKFQRNSYMWFIVMFEIQEELEISWVFVPGGLGKIRFGTNT